ncbi:Fanconi anemia, complementation group I [Operophtera brumata]|uniref:Fanconi anemia, complementation group I n=1 Tax=Operophtera brumata TaxID=104452 RepID=A0A0L7LI54_OPEBR|nr:Fanconi anemia, complementation group I [Operophtera brumata]
MWPKTQLMRAPFIIDLALALSDKGTDYRSVCIDTQLMRAPFIIDLALALSDKGTDYRSVCIDVSTYIHTYIHTKTQLMRAPFIIDLALALSDKRTDYRSVCFDLTVVGLINLAFALLAVSRVKPCAATCWSHGKLILVRLSKSQPETAPHILGQLADRLAADCSMNQYTDCLYILCKLTPVSVERCTQLSTILESCRPAACDYRSAAAVLDAVHPLLNFSTRNRDTLFMVCRKGLYSRYKAAKA